MGFKEFGLLAKYLLLIILVKNVVTLRHVMVLLHAA
jgi:hypothetical protein